MKKLIIPAALLLACCQGTTREIEQAAHEYCQATAEYDFERAGEWCTEETRQTTLAMFSRLMPMVDSAFLAADRPARIDITGVRRTTDTTATAVYHKQTPLKDFTDTLELRLRGGRIPTTAATLSPKSTWCAAIAASRGEVAAASSVSKS